MLAFFNDTKIKDKYLNRVRSHYRADEIIQGVYWEKGKGCAVGCTIEGSDHSKYETELGIPRMIARLEDRIFEGLTNGEAKEFPVKFLEAIKVGADLSNIPWKFFIWLLNDPNDGVIQYARPDGKKAIKAIVKQLKLKIQGKEITFDEWMKLRHAARAAYAAAAAAYAAAAAAYAAYAADDAAAYAAYAADDAAYAADDATAYAAAAAAYAAYAAAAAAYAAYAADAAAAYAADAARRGHYKKMADKLIELLSEAK